MQSAASHVSHSQRLNKWHKVHTCFPHNVANHELDGFGGAVHVDLLEQAIAGVEHLLALSEQVERAICRAIQTQAAPAPRACDQGRTSYTL